MKPIDMISLVSGQHDFAQHRVEGCLEAQRQEDAWIEKLRKEGIKAAHPDDGWVDRQKNTIHFAYPHFDDGARIGNKIALGQPDNFRIVTITGHANELILERWAFT